MAKKSEFSKDDVHDSFTEEQVAEFKEAFNLFPQDNKNCIKSESVFTLLRAIGHNPPQVNFKLFLSVMAMLVMTCSEESIRQAFRMFDKVSLEIGYTFSPHLPIVIVALRMTPNQPSQDGNGTIDSRELRHVMLNLGRP
eukprot:sb/3474406/